MSDLKEHCPYCGTRVTVLATMPNLDGTGGTLEYYSCHWCSHEWRQIRHLATDAPVAPV